jgi:hypothetical protein
MGDNPYELEDRWLNAIADFENSGDGRRLAELFESSLPMPPGIREQLSLRIHPRKPDIVGMRWVPERAKSFDRTVAETLPIIERFNKEIKRRAKKCLQKKSSLLSALLLVKTPGPCIEDCEACERCSPIFAANNSPDKNTAFFASVTIA